MCTQPSKDILTDEIEMEMEDLITNAKQGETVMTLMQWKEKGEREENPSCDL